MFKVGDKVKVHVPITELTASQAVKSWNGTKTRISGIRRYHTSTSSNTYTLEGCFSKYLIPYEFFEEWLIPLEEE